ncbi:MAG: DUF4388 domain-containing protein [Chloracidobacterium sp.]|uniref:DUF4388 domain-containing protein n=1 Tax=Chloracidobacterium validum TaxID=2821543 RepID=A0ABX8BCY2_9BACT|nr:DUF4388 domain-containing protein [Chloracidobacterium validum]QUW04277.1 DUF4388 domain-containing protein [Chloracidobacterium validum]
MPTSGNLIDLDLLTLTQILCCARRPAALELTRPNQRGWMYFDKGCVTHATLDTLTGEPALLALLQWREGNFRFVPNFYPPYLTMELSWAALAERALRLSSKG